MRVDEIKNGIVIDHITAGRAMQIYTLLGLDNIESTVAVLQNVPSKKMGKKDIIKIDCIMDINFDVLGFISPNITVDTVRGGTVTEKKHINLPDELTDILHCKNPRCITSTEQDIPPVSRLTDREKGIYRCVYCDTRA